jgi:hypothetical protein
MFLALFVSVVVSALFGSRGRGGLTLMLYIAPTLLFLDGWYWSSRSTLREQLVADILLSFFCFFVYGYFNGSYVLSKDVLLIVALCALPFLTGIFLMKARSLIRTT